MPSHHQRTLQKRVEISGVGLHSGEQVHLSVSPAAANTGLVFVRTDLGKRVEIPARVENVVDTRFATTLGRTVDGVSATVGTVEHLLSAFAGLGIDNARIELDGPEIPILDGSAAPFVFLLRGAGVRQQRALKRFLVVRKTVEVSEEGKLARLSPARGFRVTCSIDFDHPLVGRQKLRFDFSDRDYHREICRARTFGFLAEVEALKAAGLAQGGSLANAVVIDRFSILNREGLRFPDEFVRHKVLDSLGDLALLGMPVIGHLESHRSGHALNHKLSAALLADPSAFEILEVREPADVGRLGVRLPALGLAEAS
ncbi:MAG: UDP-3-O-acyl-N-acetylglucosamine deacetylase [Deltaproteobacteria bacterium]|nr:UDP-3-O-acyl-N-acetylglucosamine deacetylase [Deltaproteobacteria bacterium]